MASQATPKRECVSTRSTSPSPLTPGRRLSAGTRQSRMTMWACQTARWDPFPAMTSALQPGAPFSTRKPPMRPSSERAHTTATSHTVPWPIQRFSPLRA